MKPVDRMRAGPRRRALISLVMALMLPAAGFAQQQPPEPESSPPSTAVSEEEIRQFAAAVTGVREIQSRAEQEIDGIIEESELTRERFVEILESAEAEELTGSEQQAFNSAVEKITTAQTRLQQSMIEAVGDAGLTLQRFDEILAAVQADPALAERMRPYLESAQ